MCNQSEGQKVYATAVAFERGTRCADTVMVVLSEAYELCSQLLQHSALSFLRVINTERPDTAVAYLG